jgi:hypothetical protein
MNIFDELAEIYAEIDTTYANKELEARSKGYNRKELEYQKKRAQNDQAYFLFSFTRLEERINDISTRYIDSKSLHTSSYKSQRAWQIIKRINDANRLYLMDRVSFFTQIGHADYNLIGNYKGQRDTIAHGGTIPAINMTTVFADMRRLYYSLNT